MLYLISFVVFVLVMALMGLGTLLGRRALSPGCGARACLCERPERAPLGSDDPGK